MAKEVRTFCNFDKIVNYRYQISTNNKYLQERKEDDYEYYEKQEERYGQMIYNLTFKEVNKE